MKKMNLRWIACTGLLMICVMSPSIKAYAANTPLDSISLSPDVTAPIKLLAVDDEDVVTDDFGAVGTLVDLGPIPAAADVDAYHALPGGDALFSLDTTTTLSTVTAGPADVIRYSAGSYTVEFSGAAAGVPDGVNIDALTVSNGDLVMSFDVTTELGGVVYEDEDLVRFVSAGFSMFLQGASAGIDASLDVDGVHELANGRLLLSFDTAGVLGGVSFEAADVLEYDVTNAAWDMAYDASGVMETAGLNIDALAAVPAPDQDQDGVPDAADNCILHPNGPLIPDAGGNIQRDTDSDGYGNACDPDFDGDLIVNAADLAFLKTVFFTPNPNADLNGDGIVNAGDLAILKQFFFKPPGPSGLVP